MLGRKYQRDKKKKILLEVLKAGGSLTLVFVAPGASPTILKKFMYENNIKNSELKRAIKTMSEDGLISKKEKDGVVTIKLKKDGKTKALKYKVDELTIKKPKKWDKKWRLVMFDIPERKKLARNVLKEKLDELGFVLIQKSIYVCPYPCEDELEFIRSVYEIRPYVQIVVAKKIENEEKYLKKFDLI